MVKRSTVWLAMAMGLALLVGCGDDTTATVRGTVSLHGEPLESGFIILYAKSGVCVSAPIRQGQFEVRLAPLGQVAVAISDGKFPDKPDAKPRPQPGSGGAAIPGMGGAVPPDTVGPPLPGMGGAGRRGPGPVLPPNMKPKPQPDCPPIVPSKYQARETSPLQIQVEQGSNSFDFELVSP
jgi:hypothetical protein